MVPATSILCFVQFRLQIAAVYDKTWTGDNHGNVEPPGVCCDGCCCVAGNLKYQTRYRSELSVSRRIGSTDAERSVQTHPRKRDHLDRPDAGVCSTASRIYNPKINAFITVMQQDAIAQAAKLWIRKPQKLASFAAHCMAFPSPSKTTSTHAAPGRRQQARSSTIAFPIRMRTSSRD
jgi:hypothetical protein